MKAVLQRVKQAMVLIDGKKVAEIQAGLLVFLGVGHHDSIQDVDYLVDKIINLRIYENDRGKMHYSILDKQYELLIVPQFTILGNCKKGRRPDFSDAAPPAKGSEMFELFFARLQTKIVNIQKGVFKAHMHVSLVNDGPVTLIIDSYESSKK